MNNIILLSGGIDSASCIKFCLDQNISSSALFIDYNQPSNIFEKKAAQDISAYYRVSLECISINFNKNFKSGNIIGRNAFLLSAALMYIKSNVGTITIGVHKGTGYIDCSQKFIDVYQEIIDLYTEEQIKIITPFLNFSKPEIWRYAKEHDVPLNKTYSCERGLEQPCGKCKSCQDLIELYDSETK